MCVHRDISYEGDLLGQSLLNLCCVKQDLTIACCNQQVHRLVVVDESDVVKGIVSLSDILQALVLPGGQSLD